MFDIDRYKEAFDDVHASDRVQREVLNMTTDMKPRRKRLSGKRIAILAAAAALVIALGMAAYAVITMDGFALTGGMRKASVDKMLEDYSPAIRMELVEPDGTVHYLDKQGNEIMVLSAEEAAKYEQEQLEAWENAVRSSTTLIDTDTLGFLPASITELEVGPDGTIPDFALGNGHMVILCGADRKGWLLEAGDSVTLMLASNDDCHLGYRVFRDGAMLSEGVDAARVQSHTFSFEAAEPGSYCLGLMYSSVTASNFTNGTLSIKKAP